MIADHETLVSLLAQSSGLERARAVVDEECKRLGIAHPPTGAALERVVQALAQRSGAVGTSIRLFLRREEARGVTPPKGSITPEAHAAAHSASTEPLVRMLAPALGDEKAEHVVSEACARLGLRMLALTPNDQRRVLDLLSAGSDYVATVARFAKARTLLGT